MTNGWRKIILSAIGVIITLSMTGLWYQLHGYARADDLEAAKKVCTERAVESKKQDDILKKDVGDVKVAIGRIDTALQILLDDYKEAKKKGRE